MPFPTKPIEELARLMQTDLESILSLKEHGSSLSEFIVSSTDSYLPRVSSDVLDVDFVVDYGQGRFAIGDTMEWKNFELPYWEKSEYKAHIVRHLTTASRKLGGDERMRYVLLKGAARTLGSLADRLSYQGQGAVAALVIDEVAHLAAETAVRRWKEELAMSPYLVRMLRSAWYELAELCVRGIYRDEYHVALLAERRGRRLRRAKLVAGSITWTLAACLSLVGLVAVFV